MTDREVVQGVLAGRRDLFAVLVERYKGLVFAAVVSCSPGIAADAEDMAQEVFLKAYRFLGQYRGDAPFSTWLYRIALNHLKDCRRREGPPTVPLEVLARERAGRESGGDPEEKAAAAETRLLVQACLAELPEIYRRAIYLYHYQGLSYAEIGERLNLSARSVETRLYRAKKMLRHKLQAREVPVRCAIL